MRPEYDKSIQNDFPYSEILTGDFASYALILESIYRSCCNVDIELLEMIT